MIIAQEGEVVVMQPERVDLHSTHEIILHPFFSYFLDMTCCIHVYIYIYIHT